MKTFDHILNQSSKGLGRLLEEGAHSGRLNKLFFQVIADIDESFSQHCCFIVLKKNKLTIVLESAQWATKIRYQVEKISRELKKYKEFQGVEKISFMIDRVDDQKVVRKISREPLSEKNAKLWQETLAQLRGKNLL